MKIEGHIKNKILRVQMLAFMLTEQKLAHVFVRYYGHVNLFEVEALRIDTQFAKDKRKPSDKLFTLETYLHKEPEANEALNKMIDALEDIQLGALA